MLRILRACGGREPEVLKGEQEGALMGPITQHPRLNDTLSLARDDAARMERSAVAPDNLVVGMLRLPTDMVWTMLHAGGVDVLVLKEKLGDRYVKDAASLAGGDIPLSDTVVLAMSGATIRAMGKRRTQMHIVDLLACLLRSGDDDIAALLASAGGNITRVRERAEEYG
jgi:ATP-dependent Clp protease ATP-binding subunit ClpA